MRFSLLAMLAVLEGCQGSVDASDEPGGGEGSGSDSTGECQLDVDCALAGTDCCACPTYAVPVDDPTHTACEDVPCQPESCAGNVRAACHQGECVLACAPITCELSCDEGFALDANGCLTCECAGDQSNNRACIADTDCTRVDADCCGCALGGNDTAVPNADVTSYEASLNCPQNPQCPGVDICAQDLAPACIQGACALVQAPPAGECGLTGQMACVSPEVCTLNVNDDATMHTAGICQSP